MTHRIGFKYAWAGIKYAFSTQPNFLVHSVFAILAIIAGVFFGLSPTEWVVLLLTIISVFGAEMINTAIEAMTDLIEEKNNHYAKIAKDVSAGMVLLVAICSVLVGLVLFLPKVFSH